MSKGSPKVWGFVLRASDLRAASRRRFVLQFGPAGALLERPPAPPPAPPPVVLPRRRR